MINNDYHILKLDSFSYLVITTTWRRTGYYLDSIIKDFNELGDIKTVFFDFLMKNGLNDRFYKAEFNKTELRFKSFIPIEVDKEIENKANAYFSQKLDLLRDSPLTPAQKFLIRKKVSTPI